MRTSTKTENIESEQKTLITEIKKISTKGIDSRLEDTEESISDLGNREWKAVKLNIKKRK